jgi:hypothetical protein
MKDKAAIWMQPFVDDYLANFTTATMRQDTCRLFSSWSNFREEMRRMFGEVDAKDQAEKAITRLKQTKSVSAYTAEFKQLQSRIDWDDDALRTAFENGLKDTIKDALVHHDKPGDLQTLVEIATRIDNRLWERAQQKGQNHAPAANTKKHRRHIRIDKEGDVIMADKVQSKDRKPSGKRQDGLSKEERQRRYDSKACLRCGEVGHFRRDCLKNDDTGKQGAIKIGMIKGIPRNQVKQLLNKVEEKTAPLWGDEDEPKAEKPQEQCTERYQLLWHECIQDDCVAHAGIKHQTGWYPSQVSNKKTKARYEGYAEICTDSNCEQHETCCRHEQLEWISCNLNDYRMECSFHYFQKHAVSYDQYAWTHKYLDDTDCNDGECRTHAKELDPMAKN